MKIFLSNLGDQITDESLRAAFATFGVVRSINIVVNQQRGHQRNFAIIEMPDKAEATAAIARINGCIINGRMVSAQAYREEEFGRIPPDR